MHPLEQLTLDIFRRDHLGGAADAVLVVAVSGGSDSVALLHVLARLREQLGVSLHAVYVDHGLRPQESPTEIDLVQSLAGKLGLGCEIVRVQVRDHARNRGLSLEHAARELRYSALRDAAAVCGARTIAVAHTADDQAEEVLIRLLRGGGIMALSGMRTRSGDLIRPFLAIGKQDILAYLSDRNLPFSSDSSNTDMRFLRNRVRHQLLPYLEEHFDRGVRSALRKSADCLAEDEALLAELTEQALAEVVLAPEGAEEPASTRVRLQRAVLVDQPKALQRRVIEKLLWQVGGRASHVQIIRIMEAARSGTAGSELHLGRGLRVGVQREYLEFLFPVGQRAWRGRLYPAGPEQSMRKG